MNGELIEVRESVTVRVDLVRVTPSAGVYFNAIIQA